MTLSSNKDPFWIALGIYGALGVQLAISVVAGWFLGDYFDGRFHSTPWLALLGLVIGFAGGLYNLIRVLNWRQKRQN